MHIYQQLNLKAKSMNQQNNHRLINTENILTSPDGSGWGLGGKGEGTEQHKFVATEQSWGREVEHREESR